MLEMLFQLFTSSRYSGFIYIHIIIDSNNINNINILLLLKLLSQFFFYPLFLNFFFILWYSAALEYNIYLYFIFSLGIGFNIRFQTIFHFTISTSIAFVLLKLYYNFFFSSSAFSISRLTI